jgi:hypothetical protein
MKPLGLKTGIVFFGINKDIHKKFKFGNHVL